MEQSTASQVSLASLQVALAGRYTFERELGRGGMATVFLAHDLERDRLVALKVLLPELVASLGAERFLREIAVGSLLQHPHIVGVIDSGQSEGLLYYTMPYVEGASLRDRLERETQLSIDDTIDIARQVAGALAFAHSQGVIHRDIKPENILLGDAGAMVADFGIARAVSVAGGETLTRTGMSVGTPAYMSPEQAMGSADVTAESDVYSLACVVYEMLAGQTPFAGPTAVALFARHSLDRVPSLKIVRATVPDAVEDAIVRAMAKVPADRFRSATDFAAALTDSEGAARRRRDSLANQALPATTVEQPAFGARRKRAMLATAVALPLLVAAGWMGWRAMSSGSPPAGLEGDFAKQNIAVMYFEDRSPGHELGYLADGLTESLIDELSAVPQLRVVSRNGSAAFKGKTGIPSDSIARALRVGTLVTGTLEPMAEGRVRVTVRLEDALSGNQIDRTEIEHDRSDALVLQDSLAHRVSLFLRQRVGEEIQALVSRVGTSSTPAWEALQRAHATLRDAEALVSARDVPAALGKFTAADLELAEVEKLDANWRSPIIERGWLSYRASRLLAAGSPESVRWIDAGLGHADRALAMASTDADALELRGTLHYLQWLLNLAPSASAAAELMASAERDLRATIAAEDQRASAWNVLSHLLINKGQLSEAKLAAENAYRADPFLTDVDRTILRAFLASLDLGFRDEAARWCNEGQVRFPGSYRFVECRLWLYTLPATEPPSIPEVWQTYEQYVAASPANVQEFDRLKGRMMVALALVRAGNTDSAMVLAESSLGDPQIDPRGELTNLASIVYAQSGNTDAALELIARFLAANPQQRAFAAQDRSWWLKDLRSDPRYKALVGGTQ